MCFKRLRKEIKIDTKLIAYKVLLWINIHKICLLPKLWKGTQISKYGEQKYLNVPKQNIQNPTLPE